MRACTQVRAFLLYSPQGMRTPTGVRQLATPVGQTAHAVSGLPQGERSESIPSPPYFKKSSYASTGFSYVAPTGDENPDGVRQLATPVGQTASLRAGCPTKTPGAFLNNACVAPQGEARMGRVTASEASQSPSPPYFKKSSYACTGFSHVAPQTSRGRQQCLSRATRPYPPVARLSAAPPGGCPKQQSPG